MLLLEIQVLLRSLLPPEVKAEAVQHVWLVRRIAETVNVFDGEELHPPSGLKGMSCTVEYRM
jgi:hypothetical protein